MWSSLTQQQYNFPFIKQKIVVNYAYKFEETYRQANKILFNEHNRLILSAH